MSFSNPFTQSSHYAARLDSSGFCRWLLGPAADRYRFVGWLTSRSGHLVAELVERSVVSLPWALVVAFTTEADPALYGQLVEDLGVLMRDPPPTEQPDRRFQPAAAVVHLNGNRRVARSVHFAEGGRLTLEPRELNLAGLDAAPLLEAIAQGTLSRAVLPWIPLLRGSDQADLIARWQSVAQEEPLAERRADYAALALVFAELGLARDAWTTALEDWDVTASAQVQAWQEQARQEATQQTKAGCLIALLEGRFKKIPATVTAKIKATQDLALLDEWFTAALTTPSLAEFRKLLKEKEG